ncbi:hypothetical protein A7P95_00030 [Eikenella longinqua]|uniref:Uncharacterized protein n=1 Tax=Eikenella longinqua TaxID=1795827 RepID=A0A1A9S2R7_9NEIS|nr:IS110 family transposase [Eikenella longinqua]OAM32022.1 hypothetical protein A7P95_00030 [Eikenella longinqua]
MQQIALGLDISKLTIDAHFNGQNDFMRVMNNPTGIAKLMERIQSYQQQNQQIHACCEYTGVYYLPVANALHEAAIKISVVNPLSIKLYAEYKLRRTKTDKQDAKLIADYCQRENPPLWQPLSEKRKNLKALNRRIEQLNVLLNMESNRKEVSDPVIKSGIDTIINAIQNEIASCKTAIQDLIDSDKELSHNQQLLQTISGVGKTTAAWLLSVLVDIDKFENSKKLISYLGLSPVIKDSGTSVKYVKISKMGDKMVRKALYYLARAACLRSKLWRPWFEQKLKQGKHPKQIYVLMMCKIIKYAYAVIKSGQPFDENRHKPA